MLNDLVDMTAAVTDHEFDVYDSGGEACGHVRNVQIDHHAAGAVGIDLVRALFLPGGAKSSPAKRWVRLPWPSNTLMPVTTSVGGGGGGGASV